MAMGGQSGFWGWVFDDGGKPGADAPRPRLASVWFEPNRGWVEGRTEPDMRVHFDGLIAAPRHFNPTQLSVVAPPGIAGARETNGIVEMKFDWGHAGDPRRCKVRFCSS